MHVLRLHDVDEVGLDWFYYLHSVINDKHIMTVQSCRRDRGSIISDAGPGEGPGGGGEHSTEAVHLTELMALKVEPAAIITNTDGNFKVAKTIPIK